MREDMGKGNGGMGGGEGERRGRNDEDMGARTRSPARPLGVPDGNCDREMGFIMVQIPLRCWPGEGGHPSSLVLAAPRRLSSFSGCAKQRLLTFAEGLAPLRLELIVRLRLCVVCQALTFWSECTNPKRLRRVCDNPRTLRAALAPPSRRCRAKVGRCS